MKTRCVTYLLLGGIGWAMPWLGAPRWLAAGFAAALLLVALCTLHGMELALRAQVENARLANGWTYHCQDYHRKLFATKIAFWAWVCWLLIAAGVAGSGAH
jgi:hypothetical protein